MSAPELRVLLSNVRSSHNVGAIFRTADGAGVSKIYLGGYTPAPIDRYGRVVDEIKKTSLGATETVAWESVLDEEMFLQKIKDEGFTLVAVEQHERAAPYTSFEFTKPTLFIFGNEIEGIHEALCTHADTILAIPMYGEKESLNVSTAAGIILFHARSRQST